MLIFNKEKQLEGRALCKRCFLRDSGLCGFGLQELTCAVDVPGVKKNWRNHSGIRHQNTKTNCGFFFTYLFHLLRKNFGHLCNANFRCKLLHPGPSDGSVHCLVNSTYSHVCPFWWRFRYVLRLFVFTPKSISTSLFNIQFLHRMECVSVALLEPHASFGLKVHQRGGKMEGCALNLISIIFTFIHVAYSQRVV